MVERAMAMLTKAAAAEPASGSMTARGTTRSSTRAGPDGGSTPRAGAAVLKKEGLEANPLNKKQTDVGLDANLESAMECSTFFQLVSPTAAGRVAIIPAAAYAIKAYAHVSLGQWEMALESSKKALALERSPYVEFAKHLAQGVVSSWCGELRESAAHFTKAAHVFSHRAPRGELSRPGEAPRAPRGRRAGREPRGGAAGLPLPRARVLLPRALP